MIHCNRVTWSTNPPTCRAPDCSNVSREYSLPENRLVQLYSVVTARHVRLENVSSNSSCPSDAFDDTGGAREVPSLRSSDETSGAGAACDDPGLRSSNETSSSCAPTGLRRPLAVSSTETAFRLTVKPAVITDPLQSGLSLRAGSRPKAAVLTVLISTWLLSSHFLYTTDNKTRNTENAIEHTCKPSFPQLPLKTKHIFNRFRHGDRFHC